MQKPALNMVFGAQYFRPPFPDKSCWARDMANMRGLGFNTIKLWAVWNAIEYRQGVCDFADLDALLDLAHGYGLRAVINIIPEGAPYWTRTGNEDAHYRTASGQPVVYGGPANLPTAGWPGLCMDKPQVEALVTGFVEAVAAHVAAHPAMLALDVWNEPHLEPMFDYRDDMLCYCPHSLSRFRAWLQEKYGALEALNRAWFRTYTDWEQVDAPPRIGTWADMMDWRLFWLDNMRRWMRARVQAARRGAPGLLIQSHVAYSGYVGTNGNGGLANELGDEFLLARETDVFGLTCFPKWLMRADPFFNHQINNEIVAAAARDKPFYQVELQGGGGKAGLLGGEVPTARDVRLWNWGHVAAGGKGVTYWQYAPEPAGVESPGFGLTGFQGENTERSREAGACARALNHPALAAARPVPCANAVYLSRTNSVWFYSAERRERLYAQAIHGLYQAAFLQGIPMGFAHQDYVDTLYADGVRALFLPMPMVLSQAEMDALAGFIRQGGTVVSEAFPGLYGQGGTLDAQGRALASLFGLNHVEVQGLAEGAKIAARNADETAFVGSLYRHVAAPLPGTEVKAVFDDGAPAWTERSMGAGKGVWLGAFVALEYAARGHACTQRLLGRYLHRGGYTPWQWVSVSSATQGSPRLAPYVRLLQTDAQYLVVAVNPLEEHAQITVQPREPWGGEVTLRYALAPGQCTWQAYDK
ncbi:MAG: beta-galactosidase [Oscillospiraceae bacterium]|jgi:beta-galactosidase GanA|nr:beta-galactosidase [Oscillospiraceae bacterium]